MSRAIISFLSQPFFQIHLGQDAGFVNFAEVSITHVRELGEDTGPALCAEPAGLQKLTSENAKLQNCMYER